MDLSTPITIAIIHKHDKPLYGKMMLTLDTIALFNTLVTKGVPRDPRFVFRAFYYFRLRFLTVIFLSNYQIRFFWRKKKKKKN